MPSGVGGDSNNRPGEYSLWSGSCVSGLQCSNLDCSKDSVQIGNGETKLRNVPRINRTITPVGMKPSGLARKLESRLGYLVLMIVAEKTATIAKMSLVTILWVV